ncbi:MAG: 30S ribosomal protein S12 methylthiotransferase RimO [Acidobacteriota bacterium]|nr:30S ribosomal protein S12 methylthiotransferase RimO [Acidobacteriota bacterium]
MAKVGFVSLGCPKNLVDGEVMMGLVRQAGHELTADADDADILVVNTCAFIDEAKQESIDAILEMAGKKTAAGGSAKRLVVTGCLGERYRDELKKEIPEIDAVLGTGDVPEIVAAISGVRASGASPLTFYKPSTKLNGSGAQPAMEATYLYDASTPRYTSTPKHYSYIKIAEGCDYTCAFCIIPTLRGSYRSRTEDSVVQEAEALAARGVKELLLISQDTTFYGNDLRDPRTGHTQRGALGRLLRRLNTVEGLEWIRLLYLYPTTITDDTLDAMAECDKVCKYVDLPLQHASADVLRRMRRPGNRQAYDKLLARIRTRVPGVTLRTTFIVGFPGETDAEFAELEQFVRETNFDHVGVFTYSHEEGTRAHAVEDDVPVATKGRRRDALMRLQKRIVAARQKARTGSVVRVMVDGPSADSPLVWQGRLEGQAPDIDAVVYLDQCDPDSLVPGTIVEARINGARGYDVVAAPIG